jgi:CheY-like chemotaxis protein
MRPSKKVLVVDDNPVNLEICREILEGDYDVVTASEGAEAIRMALRHRPFAVLLDVMLPDMDGYEICRRMKSRSELRNTAIIMVSAKAMPSERSSGISAGADDYVTKPFDDSDLLAAVRTFQHAAI